MPNGLDEAGLVLGVFHALADATRLAIVERLSIGPVSTTELAKPFAMALPSFMQHLDVLAAAGVVTSHKSGRVRMYQLAPAALGQAETWLAGHRNHWARRLDQLDALLVEDPETDQTKPLTPASKEQS
jgi:DNA-binding transcriptional ArsR family regulator